MTKPIKHVAFALVCRDGNWLVGERNTPDQFRGLWEFPGGKIEPGETAGQAAVRECAEEVGLIVRALAELAIVEHDYGTFIAVIHPVICRHIGGVARPVESTVRACRWLPLSELAQLPMPDANQAILKALRQWEASAAIDG